MLPEDIINIILKYQNFYEVEEIDKGIQKIIKQLKQINSNILEQLLMLMVGIEVDSSKQQLLDDSRAIRNYISTIKFVFQIENNNNTSIKKNTDKNEINLYDKVYINVTSDYLCPKCNVHLESHEVFYRIKQTDEHIWYNGLIN